MIMLGSHVGMSAPDMFLGSVKEALEYGANTFMVYTGAPQNTVRKPLETLKIKEGQQLMRANGIETFVIHAPYIINLANTINNETYNLAIECLTTEILRTNAMGSNTLILHPGAHVGAGPKAGIAKLTEGLNTVLDNTEGCNIALETMAGKGTEIGRTFEELEQILDGVHHKERMRICFDTCHVNDAGYDIKNSPEEVFEHFDQVIGKKMISVFHINDSVNILAASKDRHANIGAGTIGLEPLKKIVHMQEFENIPKILETPFIPSEANPAVKLPPYKEEIAMLKA